MHSPENVCKLLNTSSQVCPSSIKAAVPQIDKVEEWPIKERGGGKR